jgi:hypothetical protein
VSTGEGGPSFSPSGIGAVGQTGRLPACPTPLGLSWTNQFEPVGPAARFASPLRRWPFTALRAGGRCLVDGHVHERVRPTFATGEHPGVIEGSPDLEALPLLGGQLVAALLAHVRPSRFQAEGLEQFIRVWQSSQSAAEAARRLGMPKPIAAAGASSYRKAGIALKGMARRGRRSLDVEGLNRLIEELARNRDTERRKES